MQKSFTSYSDSGPILALNSTAAHTFQDRRYRVWG